MKHLGGENGSVLEDDGMGERKRQEWEKGNVCVLACESTSTPITIILSFTYLDVAHRTLLSMLLFDRGAHLSLLRPLSVHMTQRVTLPERVGRLGHACTSTMFPAAAPNNMVGVPLRRKERTKGIRSGSVARDRK